MLSLSDLLCWELEVYLSLSAKELIEVFIFYMCSIEYANTGFCPGGGGVMLVETEHVQIKIFHVKLIFKKIMSSLESHPL